MIFYLHVSTLFLFAHTEPQVFIDVLTYYLIHGIKLSKLLSHLVRIFLNLQHQTEYTFTVAGISVSVVRADIANKTD